MLAVMVEMEVTWPVNGHGSGSKLQCWERTTALLIFGQKSNHWVVWSDPSRWHNLYLDGPARDEHGQSDRVRVHVH